MKAFIYSPNGQFPDVNHYLAWKGYNTIGYSSVLFDNVDTAEITKETPIFAGSRTFDKVMSKLNIKYSSINTYPDSLKSYYNRNIEKSTLGEVKQIFGKNNTPIFVKPIKNKLFNGSLWKSFLDLIPLAKIPDDVEVFLCEPVKFISEFRVYVTDQEVVGIKHYHGDLRKVPSDLFINNAIREYKKESQLGYAIDVGMIEKNGSLIESVIEINDGTSLGNYGLDEIHYAELLLHRWIEIVNNNK